jgi:3D (Asp-Asp-Asp) domain-containing protein
MKNLRPLIAIIISAILIALFCYAGQAKAVELPEKDFTDPSIFWPMQSRISFYTSDVNETDDSPEIAANGQNIWELYKNGSNTCASNNLKFGTILYIPSIGFCVVRDRMNKRFDNTFRVDYYMGYDKKRAKMAGIKNLRVKVFKKM